MNVYEFVGNRVLEVHGFENINSFSITHRIVMKLNNKKTLYQAFINMWTSMAKNVIDKIAASSWVHFTLKNPPPLTLHSLQINFEQITLAASRTPSCHIRYFLISI